MQTLTTGRACSIEMLLHLRRGLPVRRFPDKIDPILRRKMFHNRFHLNMGVSCFCGIRVENAPADSREKVQWNKLWYLGEVTDQAEWRPVIRARGTLANRLNRLLQCNGLVLTGGEMLVKSSHEFPRTAILNIPKCQQSRPGSGVNKATDEPQ